MKDQFETSNFGFMKIMTFVILCFIIGFFGTATIMWLVK